LSRWKIFLHEKTLPGIVARARDAIPGVVCRAVDFVEGAAQLKGIHQEDFTVPLREP